MARNLTASGHLHTVLPTKVISDSFRVREFVLERDQSGKYPQLVLFQATNDACEKLDELHVGDEIEVEFDLRGRQWTNRDGDIKFFNSLKVWRWDVLKRDAPPAPAPAPSPAVDDDIPF
tara:strand:- start:4304 stop:4660 length:357 start_codon:yes stop_codon:yes gene_type:complete